MELWIVLNSLNDEPEPFTNLSEAKAFALEILENYQNEWKFDQEDYEEARNHIINSNISNYLFTYFGECVVSIYKKFLDV